MPRFPILNPKNVDIQVQVTISVKSDNEAMCDTTSCDFITMCDFASDPKAFGWYCNLFPGSKLRDVKAGTKRCAACLSAYRPVKKEVV